MRFALPALFLALCALSAPAAPLHYKPAPTISTGFYTLRSLAAGDFNGDGRPDLAVTDSFGKQVVVYLNKGDGTFGAPVATTLNITNTTGTLVAGDFNEDGRTDLIVATIAGAEQDDLLLLGNGNGTFTPGAVLPGSIGFNNATALDVNHDSHLDLIVPGGDALTLYLGDGHGGFTPQSLHVQGINVAFFDVAAADFNQDGNVDFVTTFVPGFSDIPMFFPDLENKGLRLFTGHGDGSVSPPSVLTSSSVTHPAYVKSADFNGDRKLDLLVGQPDTAFVLFGNGNATFNLDSPTSFALPTPNGILGQNSPLLATADLDANGTPDVVIADNLSQTIDVFLNDGSGSFSQPAPDFSAAAAFGSGQVELADLNSDGLPDIIVPNYKTGLITILLATTAHVTPSVTLAGTPSQLAGAPLNLTVSVTGTQGLPGGSVTLLEGATLLANQPLDSAGQASFPLTSLPVGAHLLSAAYAGDRTYLPLGSPTFATTVTDFQLSLAAPSQTVAPGGAATYSLAVAPLAGFTGTVSATCSGLPAGDSCIATPVTLNGQISSIAVSVSTAKASPAAVSVSEAKTSSAVQNSVSGVLFCFVLPLLLPLRRRRVQFLLTVLLASASLGLVSGCSSTPSSTATSNTHSTTFTITASTTQGTQILSHQVAATLTVKP